MPSFISPVVFSSGFVVRNGIVGGSSVADETAAEVPCAVLQANLFGIDANAVMQVTSSGPFTIQTTGTINAGTPIVAGQITQVNGYADGGVTNSVYYSFYVGVSADSGTSAAQAAANYTWTFSDTSFNNFGSCTATFQIPTMTVEGVPSVIGNGSNGSTIVYETNTIQNLFGANTQTYECVVIGNSIVYNILGCLPNQTIEFIAYNYGSVENVLYPTTDANGVANFTYIAPPPTGTDGSAWLMYAAGLYTTPDNEETVVTFASVPSFPIVFNQTTIVANTNLFEGQAFTSNGVLSSVSIYVNNSLVGNSVTNTNGYWTYVPSPTLNSGSYYAITAAAIPQQEPYGGVFTWPYSNASTTLGISSMPSYIGSTFTPWLFYANAAPPGIAGVYSTLSGFASNAAITITNSQFGDLELGGYSYVAPYTYADVARVQYDMLANSSLGRSAVTTWTYTDTSGNNYGSVTATFAIPSVSVLGNVIYQNNDGNQYMTGIGGQYYQYVMLGNSATINVLGLTPFAPVEVSGNFSLPTASLGTITADANGTINYDLVVGTNSNVYYFALNSSGWSFTLGGIYFDQTQIFSANSSAITGFALAPPNQFYGPVLGNVSVYIDNVFVGNTYTDNNGYWTYVPPTLSSGTHTVTAAAMPQKEPGYGYFEWPYSNASTTFVASEQPSFVSVSIDPFVYFANAGGSPFASFTAVCEGFNANATFGYTPNSTQFSDVYYGYGPNAPQYSAPYTTFTVTRVYGDGLANSAQGVSNNSVWTFTDSTTNASCSATFALPSTTVTGNIIYQSYNINDLNDFNIYNYCNYLQLGNSCVIHIAGMAPNESATFTGGFANGTYRNPTFATMATVSADANGVINYTFSVQQNSNAFYLAVSSNTINYTYGGFIFDQTEIISANSTSITGYAWTPYDYQNSNTAILSNVSVYANNVLLGNTTTNVYGQWSLPISLNSGSYTITAAAIPQNPSRILTAATIPYSNASTNLEISSMPSYVGSTFSPFILYANGGPSYAALYSTLTGFASNAAISIHDSQFTDLELTGYNYVNGNTTAYVQRVYPNSLSAGTLAAPTVWTFSDTSGNNYGTVTATFAVPAVSITGGNTIYDVYDDQRIGGGGGVVFRNAQLGNSCVATINGLTPGEAVTFTGNFFQAPTSTLGTVTADANGTINFQVSVGQASSAYTIGFTSNTVSYTYGSIIFDQNQINSANSSLISGFAFTPANGSNSYLLSNVSVYIDNALIGTTVTNSAGIWTFVTPTLSAGTYTVLASSVPQTPTQPDDSGAFTWPYANATSTLIVAGSGSGGGGGGSSTSGNINNYGLTGIASNVQFGKQGPRIVVDSAGVEVRDVSNSTLVNMKVANGIALTDAVNLSQLQNVVTTITNTITTFQNSVNNVSIVGTISARNALTNLIPGDICYVANGNSGDPTVPPNNYAVYVWTGATWNLISTQTSAKSDAQSDVVTVTYQSSSSTQLGYVSGNNRIASVSVTVVTPFNGNWGLSAGDATNNSNIISNSLVDLTIANAVFTTVPTYVYPANTQTDLFVYLTTDGSVTQGAATVAITFA